MTNKKTPASLKVLCHKLNRVVSLKKLSARQKVTLFNKLVKLIEAASPGNYDLVEFSKLVIMSCLTNEEKKVFISMMKSFEDVDPKSEIVILQQYQLLSIYFSAITDVYPEFTPEYVLLEVNGELPNIEDMILIDTSIPKDSAEFRKELEAVTKKKKKPTPPSNKLLFNNIKDFEILEQFLKSNIIGQDEAVEKTCNALKLKAAGFSKWISLFFLGKTGRGKTQLAKKLAEVYTPNFWKIDCAEFQNGHEISRLIGAPPGYIGHTNESLIKTKSDKSNKWVILFDEIEKAHPKLYNFLLALLDSGRVTDNIGNEIDLSESVFIFTSNCGMSDLKDNSMNWKFNKSETGDREEVMKALEREFTPEFRGRIDEFVFFNDLTKSDIEKIVKLNLSKYPIKITPSIVNHILEVGYTEKYGARDLERTIKRLIGLPLSEEILKKKSPNDGTNSYDVMVDKGLVTIINTQ